jgi:hypothetical protein
MTGRGDAPEGEVTLVLYDLLDLDDLLVLVDSAGSTGAVRDAWRTTVLTNVVCLCADLVVRASAVAGRF